ncbi:hypothetical protein O6R08_03100 [Cutibacterium equinum]|uniref:Uncharacterized protein n=1 Tax=Cutibacterium equinum TaxID=3016342 RepID=A0ABY7QZP1_9ACTN|nr:hypothetical protein [Cutibacterium equinum]WCC80513.1 hypothetical protein O6R08_03100 [Cutibacterium equinum]
MTVRRPVTMFVCLAAVVAAAGCAEKTPTVADIANQPGATPIVNSVPPQPVRAKPSTAASSPNTMAVPVCKGSTASVEMSPVKVTDEGNSVEVIVRNCAEKPLTLPSVPKITVTSDGSAVKATWQSQGIVPGQLLTGMWRKVTLSWPGQGSCGSHRQVMSVEIAGDTVSQEGCIVPMVKPSATPSPGDDESPEQTESPKPVLGSVVWSG